MLLTPYGYREWMTISVVAAILAAMAIVLLPTVELGLIAAGVIAVLWLAAVSFFRDPFRRIPPPVQRHEAGPIEFLSPADGTISAIEHVEGHEAMTGGGPAVIIRIFLSVLNVHINRAPCDGEVVSLKYTPGRFLNAQTEESARVNECNLIVLAIGRHEGKEARRHAATYNEQRTTNHEPRNPTGLTPQASSLLLTETIGVRQVSGMIARRIVCAVKVGDRVIRGQKFGMIKFGSTTELILPRPDDVTVHVRKGDKVKAGVTVLATMIPLEERLGELFTTEDTERRLTSDL